MRVTLLISISIQDDAESPCIFLPKGMVGTVLSAEGREIRVSWDAVLVDDKSVRDWEWCVAPENLELAHEKED